MYQKRTPSPLVTEVTAARLRSSVKTTALCLNLEESHAQSLRCSTPPALNSPFTYSRKLREALEYSCTGSWFVDNLEIPKIQQERFVHLTRDKRYVDRFVDTWTSEGSPKLWGSTRWGSGCSLDKKRQTSSVSSSTPTKKQQQQQQQQQQ